MNKQIQDFIGSKSIAVVGASRSRKKFGNSVFRALKEKGFQVYAVNPSTSAIEGETSFPDLKSIPERVDAAVVLTSPENSSQLVEDALEKGIKKLWFQQGADFSEIAERAREKGINTISKKCILMYAPPVKGGHAVHRFFAKIFGKL